MQLMKLAFQKVAPDMVDFWQAMTDEDRRQELEARGLGKIEVNSKTGKRIVPLKTSTGGR